ncbi:hypothetical protein K1718_22065 [Roseibium porphyridii]|uniref:Uncharacterized protein n=1 Tax=Roseibium porphyridii TaxID=2866279 RepID=A0ABY8F6B3_9HYPH|nr:MULTISPECIES: hypothetical protein [Stappiaceae]QFT33553.1 hypothetical protein FIV00_23880 [Labrenzia sp. THAF82]WFE88820.1 hypothetical protein K1718_22065 [Roseibium sp. KMA01]
MRMPLYFGLATGATVLVALAIGLWFYSGERVYADRLISMIANCF